MLLHLHAALLGAALGLLCSAPPHSPVMPAPLHAPHPRLPPLLDRSIFAWLPGLLSHCLLCISLVSDLTSLGFSSRWLVLGMPSPRHALPHC